MRRFRSSNKNLNGMVASYFVIAMGASAAILVGMAGDGLNVQYVLIVAGFFFGVALIPIAAMRPPQSSFNDRENYLSWSHVWSLFRSKKDGDERDARPWKRKRTDFVHTAPGQDYEESTFQVERETHRAS